MKKLLIGITALMLASSASMTALAAEDISYDKDANKVTGVPNVSSYSTVLISKADAELSTESIVYANQADNDAKFNNAIEFMLKSNPEDGQYKLTLGARKTDPEIMLFTIGNEINIFDEPMTILGSEPTDNTDNTEQLFNVGFSVTAEEFQNYNSIKVVVKDRDKDITGGYDIKSVFGEIEGSVKLALQINNVPVEYKDNIQVYLSTDKLDGTLVWNN